MRSSNVGLVVFAAATALPSSSELVCEMGHAGGVRGPTVGLVGFALNRSLRPVGLIVRLVLDAGSHAVRLRN